MKFAKKSLGQNFLKDKNIIKKIVSIKNILNKNIIEIGPGLGALTDEIIKKKPKSLLIIEKDSILYKDLIKKYNKNPLVKVFNKDILDFDLDKKIKKNSIIFGNLPYNISSQILVKIIKFKKADAKNAESILMFQKEMAERIVAKHGTSKYGRLSILTNYRLASKREFNISPNCFHPKPKVISSVLSFKPTFIRQKIKKINNLEKITNIFFSNRRKMINKSFKKIFKNNFKIDIEKKFNLKLRPEEIKPEKYYQITQLFEKL